MTTHDHAPDSILHTSEELAAAEPTFQWDIGDAVYVKAVEATGTVVAACALNEGLATKAHRIRYQIRAVDPIAQVHLKWCQPEELGGEA